MSVGPGRNLLIAAALLIVAAFLFSLTIMTEWRRNRPGCQFSLIRHGCWHRLGDAIPSKAGWHGAGGRVRVGLFLLLAESRRRQPVS